MAPLRQFVLRFLSLFRNGRAEHELTREVESHLALLEDGFVAEGMTRADAKLAARRAFGGVDQAKERQRDARSFRWIDDLRRDMAYAVRSLRRSPAFTMAAVLTLAIGIGATTAIYSVIDRILLQPLPFPDGDRLVISASQNAARAPPALTYSRIPRMALAHDDAVGAHRDRIESAGHHADARRHGASDRRM